MTSIAPPDPGPWIILIHASIRLLRLGAFHRVLPEIAKQLAQQPELIKSVGIGEAPHFI